LFVWELDKHVSNNEHGAISIRFGFLVVIYGQIPILLFIIHQIPQKSHVKDFTPL